MTELRFTVTSAEAKKNAASPTIAFGLSIASGERIEALVLRVELRIEPQWRQYDGREKTLLNDLFGTPDRWGTTLRTLSWISVPLVVTAFEEQTQAHIEVPCTYDFDVSATRFLTALGEGEVPLRFYFTGAIFRDVSSGISTERVSWSSEAAYRMPVAVWQEAMSACYGDDALIRIKRETMEHLHQIRARSGAASWDDAIMNSGAAT
jgi:hypothetical protein